MIYETNLMQQLWFIDKPLAQHVLGIIVPIFRSARPYITAYGFQHLSCWKPYAVIYGLALLKMGIMMPKTCWANRLVINHNCYTVHTVHTACFPASQDSSQHIKCWKPYAVIYGLVLLKMGIMMPETCWANGLVINHNCYIQLFSHVISSRNMPK